MGFKTEINWNRVLKIVDGDAEKPHRLFNILEKIPIIMEGIKR